MFKNEACEILKIKELTNVNEVLSMSVTIYWTLWTNSEYNE